MKADYINKRKELVQYLSKHLKGEKFEHSLLVEKTAIKLAKRYGADTSKAGVAGLLHDVTKQMNNIEMAKKYHIVSPVEKTLHGAVAAAYLKEQGIVEDEDVLSAIRYHTTGRADMTLLEKIVYLADYIEPSRDFDGVERLRELAKKDIDRAMLLGLAMSLCEVIKKNSLVEIDSVNAYNYYRTMFFGEEL